MLLQSNAALRYLVMPGQCISEISRQKVSQSDSFVDSYIFHDVLLFNSHAGGVKGRNAKIQHGMPMSLHCFMDNESSCFVARNSCPCARSSFVSNPLARCPSISSLFALSISLSSLFLSGFFSLSLSLSLLLTLPSAMNAQDSWPPICPKPALSAKKSVVSKISIFSTGFTFRSCALQQCEDLISTI